jgi:predicted lipid-binding transport protein (Tim44 family)
LPDYCQQNNAAAGAATGAVMGALLGGALGGGRGAAIGAGSGLLFGGLSGAQADAQCQQMAVQIAYQQAAAQQAAIQQQIAAEAARQSGPLNLPASAYVPVSADYKTPSDGHSHRVTVKRLNSFSDPASRQICDNFTRIDTDLSSNTSSTASARRCKGPDGQWRDA